MSVITLNVDEARRTLSSSDKNVFVINDKNVDIVRFALMTGFADIALDEHSALRVMYQRPGETEVRAQTLTYYDTDGIRKLYDWELLSADLAKSGALTVALCILRTDGEVEEWHTTPYQIRVLGSIHTDDSDEGDDTITPTVKERVAVLETMIQRVASGAPIVVASTSAMTDTSRIYVLKTDGKWYYHNGSSWVAGGEYGAVATDTTLTKPGMPADAKAVGDVITTIKADLGNVSTLYIYKQPELSADSGFLPFNVSKGDSLTIERTDGEAFAHADQIRFYDKDRVYIGYVATVPTGKTSRTWAYAYDTPAAFIGLTLVTEEAQIYAVINNNSKSLLLSEKNERKSVDELMDNRIAIVESQSAKAKIINRFDKETITVGKYINPNNGTLATHEAFFASDFIYIGDLTSVTVSYTHIFVWYDENKNHLTPNPDQMNSASQDLTFTRPEDAVYLRFSAYNTNINSAQIGGAVSRDNYIPYGIYKLPELQISASQIDAYDDSRIIVDASGSGDYTSFTQAIYDTVDSGRDVYVKPGNYDIVAEYIALFGQEAVDNMADADSAIFNGFQYGVRLRKRRVEFAPGAHLVCDWTGHIVNGTHRFSALGVDYNVEIIGLDLDVTATFYCIHDDYGIPTPYTVKYENCRVVGHNLINANCIGGGCKKYSRHILKNCYFDNNLTGSATVRYHNSRADGAEPEIYVSDCYFNNWFTPRWYGLQTTKMRVYVNNSHARAIYKIAESSSYDVDNVELYKWNNEETNPVTE